MKKEIIYISGYWNDTKETFTDYKCKLNEVWNGAKLLQKNIKIN